MNIVKSTALLAGAFSLAATLAQAQSFSDQADAFFRTNSLDLYFRDTKNFKMTGPYESDYLGGELNIFVGDGVTTLLSCAANGDVFYVSPNIFCPSGTTGLVTSGDIDGDGIRDTGS